MQETQVQSLARKDPWEKEMATHTTILAWRILWMEEPGRLQSWEWQPIPVFLPRKSHGQRSLAGYSPKGCKQSDSTEQLSMSSWAKKVFYFQQLLSTWKLHQPKPVISSNLFFQSWSKRGVLCIKVHTSNTPGHIQGFLHFLIYTSPHPSGMCAHIF